MTTQHKCDHCPEAEKRKAAQIENEALKERLVRAGLEQHRAVRAAVLAGNESAYQRGYMDGLAMTIEAALKYPLPDDLYDSKDWRDADYAGRVEWLHTMYEGKKAELDAHLIGREQIYTSAPPAQTPPRLTDEQISDIAVSTPPNVHTYGRAIETAVRRQFGVQE
jgi:hypothetical protein